MHTHKQTCIHIILQTLTRTHKHKGFFSCILKYSTNEHFTHIHINTYICVYIYKVYVIRSEFTQNQQKFLNFDLFYIYSHKNTQIHLLIAIICWMIVCNRCSVSFHFFYSLCISFTYKYKQTNILELLDLIVTRTNYFL